MASIIGALGVACVPTALGLIVGLQAFWSYRHFRELLLTCGLEVNNEVVWLTGELRLLSRRCGSVAQTAPLDEWLPFLEAYLSAADRAHQAFRRSFLAAIPLLAGAWVIEVVRSFGADYLPLELAIGRASLNVLIIFATACVPAYAVWVDFLHRRPATLLLPAAILCFAWCAGELLFGTFRFL